MPHALAPSHLHPHLHHSHSSHDLQSQMLLWMCDIGLGVMLIAYALLALQPYGFAFMPWAVAGYLLATRKHSNASGLVLIACFAISLIVALPQLQLLSNFF